MEDTTRAARSGIGTIILVDQTDAMASRSLNINPPSSTR